MSDPEIPSICCNFQFLEYTADDYSIFHRVYLHVYEGLTTINQSFFNQLTRVVGVLHFI